MIHRHTFWFCGALCALLVPFGCSSTEDPLEVGDAGSDSPVSPTGEAGGDDAGGADAPLDDDAGLDAATRDAFVDAFIDDASLDDASPVDAFPGDVFIPDAPTDSSATDAHVPQADASPHDASPEDASHDAPPVDAAPPSFDATAPDAGDSAACTPGAAECTPTGSAFCDATGVWHAEPTGTCTATCVDATKRFLVSADGTTVTDTRTTLLWGRSEAATTSTWSVAVDFCAAQTIAGKAARLPTLTELQGLLFDAVDDGGTCVPAIDQAAFPASSSGLTWTSEPTDAGEVEVVFFSLGNVKALPTSALASTRCVRSP